MSKATNLEVLGIIDSLEVGELQKKFLEYRWLGQLNWLKSRARESRQKYYCLRLTTIVGGTIVPALVSLNLNQAAFGVSQLVAITAAAEELFHFGENHRRYRASAESLKTEGWAFFNLSGAYAEASHEEAYASFADTVEAIIQKDLEGYIQLAKKAKAN
jgi:hypothetical protein